MIDFFSKLKDNRIFQFSVVVIIILNAILIGATTYQLDPIFLNTISKNSVSVPFSIINDPSV